MREFGWGYSGNEQPKAPYYTEPLEGERRAVVEAFYDHVVAHLSAPAEDLSVDSILAETATAGTAQAIDPSLCDQLTEMVSVDIQRHPQLLWNEMRVSGCGLYVHVDESDPEAVRSEVLPLDEGEALHGTLAKYCVTPIVAYGAYQQLEINGYQTSPNGTEEQPGLCMVLENVEQLDSSGQSVAMHDWALVPLTYDSFLFEKVVRQEFEQRPLFDILAGEALKEHFINVENDLNYNEYTGEAARRRHAVHQKELRDHVQEVEDQVLLLSGFATEMVSGEQRFLGNDEVEYAQPAIIRHGAGWRVVHGVSLIDTDTGKAVPVYICPEDIMSATWKKEG